MKQLFGILIGLLFAAIGLASTGTLTLQSQSLLSSDPFGHEHVLKQEFIFTAASPSPGPSGVPTPSTASIPTLTLPYTGGKIEKVVYIPAPSPGVSPSPAPTIKLLDPESNVDQLYGECVPAAAGTAQEFYPVATPASGVYVNRQPLILSSPILSITGNTAASAQGTVILYLKAD